MSTIYNIEPPPTAKVLLQTTSGDIELELFAKQIPLASRNFLQLCLDGYYDGHIFWRLVPGFVLQGGDPTGTGDGGEAIYPGGRFADEFHSRLKFNRRGLLGMANSGSKDDNGSQFFITLGKTEELNGKNTMFGRVVGDTIYNVMKMGDAELVPGSERPLYPTQIIGAEILLNPFKDMVKKEVKPPEITAHTRHQEKKAPKKKGGKALLSFGGEDSQEADQPILKKAKFNTRLISVQETNNSAPKDAHPVTDRRTKPMRRKASRSPTPQPRTQMEPRAQLPLPDEEEAPRSPSTSPEPGHTTRVSSILEKTNAQIAELKGSMKRTIGGPALVSEHQKSALEAMIPENALRGRKRKHGKKDTGASDAAALSILQAFRAKLDQASAESAPPRSLEHEANGINKKGDKSATITEDDEAALCDLHFIANCQSCQSWDNHFDEKTEADNEGNKGWMSHALIFDKDRLGKDLTWKKKNEQGLVVIDPREKAKEIKEEQRIRKEAKASSRAYDRDRLRNFQSERS